MRTWAYSTAIVAVAVTALDAVLLQQKKSFFTGGFLASVHSGGLLQSIGFLTTSLVVDASVAGLTAALVMWLTARVRLTLLARLFLIVAGAMTPMMIWDFVNYSLLAHLGDAFDLGLMFDLTGRNPSEIFAVASSHLVAPAMLGLVAAAAVAASVWTIDRYGPASVRGRIVVSRRLMIASCALLVMGLSLFAATSTASDLAEDGLRRKASGQLFTRLLASVSDFDGDGFGVGGRTGDPAPFDAAVYPYALDVPANGIDENDIGGDLPAGPAYGEEPAPAGRWAHRPNVVLFVLESFRADAVGRVVNGKRVTPSLDALAREGISSSRAFSHNGYTTQSRFHLLTGSLANVRRDGSLIDDFKSQGYQTAYFSAQDESFGGPALSVGFDRAEVAYDARQDRDRRYSTYTTAGSLAVSHLTLQERIEAFLRTRDADRPLFLYVNFHDTHFPYHHRDIEALVSDHQVPQRQIVPGQRAAVQEMYYNAAANVDRAVGVTLASVTRTLGAPPAVVVTGDHGESLFDEGFLGHGYALNDIQTRIPLIIRGLPVEIVEPFGQTDLRNLIGAALSRPNRSIAPRLIDDPEKAVFQYLGNIHRPRQIGFRTGADRLVYDFRDRRVLLPDGASVRPEALPEEALGPVRRLIHLWERMMLARSANGSPRDE